MEEDLRVKAAVALDLLGRGAEEVAITGTDIVVRKRMPEVSHQGSGGNTQVVNVHTQAASSSSANIVAHISVVRHELREIYKTNEKLPELEKKLDALESELSKSRPDKSKLKKYLQWLMDFGWEAFIKIMPVVLEKFVTPA